jgi:hypothetical protein
MHFAVKAPADQCHPMDGAMGGCSRVIDTLPNLRRSTTPPAVGEMHFPAQVKITDARNRILD